MQAILVELPPKTPIPILVARDPEFALKVSTAPPPSQRRMTIVEAANKKLPSDYKIQMRQSVASELSTPKVAFDGKLVVTARIQDRGVCVKKVIGVSNSTTSREVILEVVKQSPDLQSVNARLADFTLLRRVKGVVVKTFPNEVCPLAEVLNMDEESIAAAFDMGTQPSETVSGFFIERTGMTVAPEYANSPQSPDKAAAEGNFVYTKPVGTAGKGERATSGEILQRNIDGINAVIPPDCHWSIHAVAPGVFQGSLRVYLELPGGQIVPKTVTARNQGMNSTAQCVPVN